MKQGTKTLLWVVGIGGGGYLLWQWAKKMHVTPKEKAILEIETSKYAGFEDAFLQAWASAKKQGQAEFTYQSKVYLTASGRAKR